MRVTKEQRADFESISSPDRDTENDNDTRPDTDTGPDPDMDANTFNSTEAEWGSDDQTDGLDNDNSTNADGPRGDAVKANLRRWPRGVIPYTFSPSFTAAGRAAVFSAIREYRQRTCIRFVPRRGEYNYVEFINGRGCWSWAGN